MQRGQLPKDVVETDVFEKKRESIFPDTRLFDEITFGLVYTVAKKPGTFPLVPDTEIRVAKIRATPNSPAISIFYREKDENTVELLDFTESGE